MSNRICLLISFVLLLSIVGEAFGAPELEERRSWWSDLEPANHLWSEPNNWWTIDVHFLDDDGDGGLDSGETVWYVKADQNEVPDVNIAALVGKGEAHIMYPVELRNMILDGYVMTDPTIDETVIAEANYVLCGGGTSFDHYWTGDGSVPDPDMNNWDPNFHHYLTMTGGTLTIGKPQTWEGYEVVWWGDMFNGQFGPGRLCVGSVPWDEAGASGTMTMSGGTVNVGGHMEVGAWGGTGTLNMTDGTINIVQGIYCPTSWWSGTGYINLHGGTINARYIRMTEDSYGGNIGIIDVTEGKMIFEQDEKDKLILYEDYENLGSTGNILNITSYDVNHGEIITDGNFPAQVGKRAALVIDYDVSREGKTTLAAATPTEPAQAWNPSPADDAQSVRGPGTSLTRPILSWSAGDNAASHRVYFGTSFPEVNDATTSSGAYKGPQDLADVSYTVGTDLDIFGTYHWRIDEVNAVTVKGQVWDFTVANLGKASYPAPENREDEVSPVVTLGWTAGIYATTHDIYFGTSFAEVNDANASSDAFMVNQAGTTWPTTGYDSNGLEYSKTYYWRIDEKDGGTYKGTVWSFTTNSRLIVENFNSYANLDPDVYAVWNDYMVNPSDGEIWGIEKDPDIVHEGNSIVFRYNNVTKPGGYFIGSWMDAETSDLEIGSDWTLSRAAALVLYFRGSAGNSVEKMWVELEDTSSNAGYVVYDGNANDVTAESWHEWNIDLGVIDACGVTLSSLDNIKVGVGGYARTGQTIKSSSASDVYFDDFELWPVRCVPKYASVGDFTDDCTVDGYDLEVMAQDWLIQDYNTLGYAGTLMGFDDPDAAWYPTGGVDNGALYFSAIVDGNGIPDCNGAEDHSPDAYPHVEIPAIGLNSANVSMTAWIRTDGIQCGWGTGIVFIRAASASGLNLFYDNELAYHWNDQHWGFESDLFVPDDTWTFVALVVTPSSGTLYMDEVVAYDDTGGSWDPEPFADPMWIGQDYQNPGQTRNFRGWIDDVRIYDFSLTAGQIEYVRTGSGIPPAQDPFCWYKLDETSGTNAEDSSGGQIMYWPVPSPTNICGDDVEAEYHRFVNLIDFACFADYWLDAGLWP